MEGFSYTNARIIINIFNFNSVTFGYLHRIQNCMWTMQFRQFLCWKSIKKKVLVLKWQKTDVQTKPKRVWQSEARKSLKTYINKWRRLLFEKITTE